MRIFLLPIAGVLLVTGLSRAEFDGAGIAAKPNTATGATFGDVAANRRAQKVDLVFDLRVNGVFALAMPIRFAVVVRRTPTAPQPIIKNPSNIPRPRR